MTISQSFPVDTTASRGPRQSHPELGITWVGYLGWGPIIGTGSWMTCKNWGPTVQPRDGMSSKSHHGLWSSETSQNAPLLDGPQQVSEMMKRLLRMSRNGQTSNGWVRTKNSYQLDPMGGVEATWIVDPRRANSSLGSMGVATLQTVKSQTGSFHCEVMDGKFCRQLFASYFHDYGP